MKIIVICPEDAAASSHREREEEVDVEMKDTVEEVKIKITMIYSGLDPQQFHLMLGLRKLR